MEDLPPEILESFRRVVADSSVLEQTKEELEKVRIVLRSGGQPFLLAEYNDNGVKLKQEEKLHETLQSEQPKKSGKPRLVVALAHHQESDIFFLFCFSPTIVPCRFVRFDRDGNIVDTADGSLRVQVKEEGAPPKWCMDDACALAAAVNHMQKKCPEYFQYGKSDERKMDIEVEDQDPEKSRADESTVDHSECLRLVSEKEGEGQNSNSKEDVHAIRTLILDSVLNFGKIDGRNGLIFSHPNPKFLLPLSQAIADELHEWRRMCMEAYLLWNQTKRELKCYSYESLNASSIASNDEEEVKTSRDEKIGGIEKVDPNGEAYVVGQVEVTEELWEQYEQLDDDKKFELIQIMNAREKDRQICLEICRTGINAVKKIVDGRANVAEQSGQDGAKSEENENAKTPKSEERDGQDLFQRGFRLGQETARSVAALIHRQKEHPKMWGKLHPALRKSIVNQNALDKIDIPNKQMNENESLAHWIDRLSVRVRKTHQSVFDKCGSGGELINEASDGSSQNDCAPWDETIMKLATQSLTENIEHDASPNLAKEATAMLLHSWETEDYLLVNALVNTFCDWKENLKYSSSTHSAPTLQLKDWPLFRDIPLTLFLEMAEKEIESLLEGGRKATLVNALRFVNLREENRKHDGNREPLVQGLSRSVWTGDQVEAFLCFGQILGEEVEDDHLRFAFFVGHAADAPYVRGYIDSFLTLWKRGRRDDEPYPGLTALEESWRDIVGPGLDHVKSLIMTSLQNGDFFNAAILSVCCARALCHKDATKNIGEWVDFDFIYERIEQFVEKLDSFFAKIVLGVVNKSKNGKVTLGQWLDCLLRSGAIYFSPSKKGLGSKKKTSKWDFPSGRDNWHVASSIFTHNGWCHPTLCRALRGDKTSIRKWSQMESPIVVKERFIEMKRKNDANALQLARMLGGDTDAIEFLLLRGCDSEAIAQAGSSQNMEGLARLGSHLAVSSPCASLQCIHASIHLGINGETFRTPTLDVQNVLVDFVSSVLTSNDTESSVSTNEISANESYDQEKMPSLQLLSTMAFCRYALHAVESEFGLRCLFEAKDFPKSGISLASIAIAIIAQTSLAIPYRNNFLEFLLERAGLLAVTRSSDQGELSYSGWLTEFRGKYMLDICCVVYQSSKFLINSGSTSIYCMEMGLFAALKIAALTGCESFAVERIGRISNRSEDSFETGPSRSPLNCLTASYSFSFCSNLMKEKPQLLKMLLDTFLQFRFFSTSLNNHDVMRALTWVAVASLQYYNPLNAAARLTDHSEQGYCYEAMALDLVRDLLVIDSEEADNEVRYASTSGHTMSYFALSAQRIPITEIQRQQICSALVINLLKFTELSPTAVVKCVELHKRVNSSFWRLEADQVQPRLTNPEQLDVCLSDKNSLRTTCVLLHFIDYSLRRDEIWCSSYLVLVWGLSWLRNVLVSTENLLLFDQSEDINSYNFDFNAYFDRHDDDNQNVDCEPRYQAYALLAVVREYAEAIEVDDPFLSHLCQEASALCIALEFLIEPTLQKLNSYSEYHTLVRLGGSILPTRLEPGNMINFVLKSDWGSKSDFEANFTKRHNNGRYVKVPFLLQRVRIGVRFEKLDACSSLCVRAVQSHGVWDKIEKIQLDGDDLIKYTWEILQACFLVLEKVVIEEVDVSDQFLDITLHLILALNWFRCCWYCQHHPRKLNRHAPNFVPSSGNLSLLHRIALVWNGRGTREIHNIRRKISYCLDIVSCLSRCCTSVENLRSGCSYCRFKQHRLCDDVIFHPDGAEQQKKRKRELTSNVKNDFIEVKVCMENLGLNEQIIWCKLAFRECCLNGATT